VARKRAWLTHRSSLLPQRPSLGDWRSSVRVRPPRLGKAAGNSCFSVEGLRSVRPMMFRALVKRYCRRGCPGGGVLSCVTSGSAPIRHPAPGAHRFPFLGTDERLCLALV
jgi:hypothetical protein